VNAQGILTVSGMMGQVFVISPQPRKLTLLNAILVISVSFLSVSYFSLLLTLPALLE
jgi:hypothetical protein